MSGVMEEPTALELFRGPVILPTYDTRIGLSVPLAVSILIAAALAAVHRFVVDPPEDSKRKRVPKRRHIVMAPTSWKDKRTLYSTPRAFECWLKMSRFSRGGVLVGSLGPNTTRAINLEIVEGNPHILWRSRDVVYSWTVNAELPTDRWVHLVITFASNSSTDKLVCYVDGDCVGEEEPEETLPSLVPELSMLVGKDHTIEPRKVRALDPRRPARCAAIISALLPARPACATHACARGLAPSLALDAPALPALRSALCALSALCPQAFDGEIAHLRVWSCILPEEVIKTHVAGTNRIYPALTEPAKALATTELAERCARVDDSRAPSRPQLGATLARASERQVDGSSPVMHGRKRSSGGREGEKRKRVGGMIDPLRFGRRRLTRPPPSARARAHPVCRRREADELGYHTSFLLHAFKGFWPDEVTLASPPFSIDLWLKLAPGARGGVVCGSAPAGGTLTVQVLAGSGRPKLSWHAAPNAQEESYGGIGRVLFDLALRGDVRRGIWVHVAFAFVAERDAIVGYIDGIPAGEQRRLYATGIYPPDPPVGPILYAQDDTPVLKGSAEGDGGWFDGELSHVRFWSSELKPAALAAHVLANAAGKAHLAAQPVGPNDQRLAAEQRERRLDAYQQKLATADAEADADAARREMEAVADRRRQDEQTRAAKRQAADAQVKVATFMLGNRIEFDDKFAALKEVPDGWAVKSTLYGEANMAVLRSLVQLMEPFPYTRIEVHVKTGSFGGGDLSRTRPLTNVAKSLGIDPKAPKTVAEDIAQRRAMSVREALIELGVDAMRLHLKWTGLSSKSEVLFSPKPMTESDY
jgi:outer membrane protein OmpA-like peptidoglycan-associated protein